MRWLGTSGFLDTQMDIRHSTLPCLVAQTQSWCLLSQSTCSIVVFLRK